MIIRMKELRKKRVKNKIIKAIKQGAIFIYPTDTIYGLGCNAKNQESVKKIREIKQSQKPFSIIAPSKQWIYKNFKAKKSYIQKLPGPFTFIVRPNKKILPKEINLKSKNMGIRIPNHPFSKIIQESKTPFITTSVNKTGEIPVTNPKKIPKNTLKQIDIIIDDGKLESKPSTVIDITGKIAKILR